MIANLSSSITVERANLVNYINPFNNALQMPNVTSVINLASQTGLAMAEQLVSLQAAVLAYADDFRFVMMLTLAALPLVILIGSSRKAIRANAEAPHVALD